MSNSSLAFAFDEPSPPAVATAAQIMASELAAGRALSRSDVTRIMSEHFGGSDALGRWSVRDAHAALELAQVQYLQAFDQIQLSSPIEDAEQFFCRLDDRIPTQTNRSDEQIEWQQFATPARLAWLAARACALGADELALEPSAGTGMLAVWAAKAGTRLVLNEISPLRRDCLTAAFPAARVTGYDAELIDELLDPGISPSVVLMNPPYSYGIERGHDGRTGARHLRSAWNRLAPGGRLVAIMPEWFDCARFLAGMKGPASMRLNAAVERAFIKNGTGITTRLLVLDKVEGANEPVAIRTNAFRQLADLVDALPARASLGLLPKIRACRLVLRSFWLPRRAGRCRNQKGSHLQPLPSSRSPTFRSKPLRRLPSGRPLSSLSSEQDRH